MLLGTVLMLSVSMIVHAQDTTANTTETHSLQHDGFDRTYQVTLPSSYDGDTALPLVIALHATGMSGKAMQVLTDFDSAAEANDVIVVYPNSISAGWNSGLDTDPDAPHDAEFMQVLIAQLQNEYAIDPDQINLTGFGSGGLLAAQVGCDVPDQINSVAVVGPMLWSFFADTCAGEADAPVNILFVHGDSDPIYPILGDAQSGIWSVQRSLDFWAERNGCDADARTSDGNLLVYDDCPTGGNITLYTVFEGGHIWPRIGDYALNQLGIDATELVTNYFLREDDSTDWSIAQETPFSERSRGFVFYVPTTYDGSEPLPAIVLLHGKGGVGYQTAASSEMIPIAEREGIIMIYPDGVGNEWQYMKDVPIFREPGFDDTDFIRDLVSDLSQDLNIDPQRIYAAGISNGGFMTQRLACTATDVFAAYASVIASGYYAMDVICEDQPPVPIMFVHGSGDPIVPWNGSPVQTQNGTLYISLPIPQTIEFWAMHNGCSPDTSRRADVEPTREDTSVSIFDIPDCEDNGRVLLYAIINGGHTWPGVDWDYEEVLGLTNFDINAGEEIWKFFQQYTLSGTIETSEN